MDSVYFNEYNDSGSGGGEYQRSNGNSKQALAYDDTDSDDDSPEAFCTRFINCLKGSAKYRDMKIRTSQPGINSVSRIDRIARILFPGSFLLFNIMYWTLYLKIL